MRFTDIDFNIYYRKFIEDFSTNREYIIYGIGENFYYLQSLFKNELKIQYGVDKNWREIKADFPIFPPEHIKTTPHTKIIIMPGSGMYSEIVKLLQKMGITKDRYCSFQEILTLWGLNYHKKVYSNGVNCFVTTYCTLKCKACAQLTTYLKKQVIIPYENIVEDIDIYFKFIDQVQDFVIVGGEPFLYPQLGEVCKYISETYGSKYKKLKIFSNGTIIPSKQILESFQEVNNINIYLSDYSPIIKEKAKISDIIYLLEEFNINYVINSDFGQTDNQFTWFDFGDPTKPKYKNVNEIKNVFKKCSLICNNLYNKKCFYCVPAWAAFSGEVFNKLTSDDYIDFEKLQNKKKEEAATEIIKFQLGFIVKEYISFCENCNGCGIEANKKLLPAGEQKK